jgi:hypothetical protein
MARPRLPAGQRKRKLTGAQRRARDLEQAKLLAARHGYELARAGEHARRGNLGTSTISPLLQQSLEQLGPPPMKPEFNVAWTNSAAVALLWDTLCDPALEARDRRRVAADLIFKVGATYSRAFQQQKLFEIAKTILPVTEVEPVGEEIEPGEWSRRRQPSHHPLMQAIEPGEWDRLGRPLGAAEAADSGPDASPVERSPTLTTERGEE